MPIPTELSDIHSTVSGDVYVVLRIQLCIWNSLCTACSKSATGKHTGAAAGVSFGPFAPEEIMLIYCNPAVRLTTKI